MPGDKSMAQGGGEMSFTDDELKVLKAMTQSGDWPISGKQIVALIERLEAAEVLAQCLSNHEDVDPVEVTEIRNWRKACGK